MADAGCGDAVVTHAELLRALLPPVAYDATGPVSGAELAAEGGALDAAEAAAAAVLSEADPRTTAALLPDWERVLGLPDPCSAGLFTSAPERRSAAAGKIAALGGASPAYFVGVAAAMGYSVTVEELQPFRCGGSRCGADRLNGGAEVRAAWRVRVSGARFTPFRCGVSRCGESLGSLARAQDLECRLQGIKPAHTHLTLAYEGV